MKNIKQIKNEMERTRARIKENENKRAALYNLDERRAAAASGDRTKHDALIKAFKENAENIKAVENAIYTDKITLYYLTDNYKAAAAAEIMPVIKDVLKKYDRKPYGEKTKKKIHDEIFTAGGFHTYIFNDTITARFPDDYYNEIKIIAPYEIKLLDDNKINAAALDEMRAPEPYTENPATAAKNIIKKYEKALAALDAFEKALDDYNTAAPDALYKNHTCNYLYKTII